MNKEVENLLSLICQGGQIKVSGGQLLVSPPAVAQKFGEQIKRLKPRILVALGYCPKCAGELTVKVEPLAIVGVPERARTYRHSYCLTLGHHDKWEN